MAFAQATAHVWRSGATLHAKLGNDREAFLLAPIHPSVRGATTDDQFIAGPWANPEAHQAFVKPAFAIRGVPQQSTILAFAWNVGTCRLDAEGEVQMGSPHEDESTEARNRGGATRSRAEVL